MTKQIKIETWNGFKFTRMSSLNNFHNLFVLEQLSPNVMLPRASVCGKSCISLTVRYPCFIRPCPSFARISPMMRGVMSVVQRTLFSCCLVLDQPRLSTDRIGLTSVLYMFIISCHSVWKSVSWCQCAGSTLLIITRLSLK